jgi:hypothetical protein
MRYIIFSAIVTLLTSSSSLAQQNPFFAAHDHHLAEKHNLAISAQFMGGIPKHSLDTYTEHLLELEYGVTSRWSASLCMEGASQLRDSTVFRRFRLENRLKLLKEWKINPVLYFSYEKINESSQVGSATAAGESSSELRQGIVHEIEAELILSTDLKKWSITKNFIVEKNLTEDEGFKFGYAVGVFRPLPMDNLAAGLELYGELGNSEQFGFKETSHYLAPALVWSLGKNQTVKVSPGFGLTANSDRLLLQFGYTYEIHGFGQKISRLFRKNR